jgi:hypothetical protein
VRRKTPERSLVKPREKTSRRRRGKEPPREREADLSLTRLDKTLLVTGSSAYLPQPATIADIARQSLFEPCRTTNPDMNISRRREANFFSKNGPETVENDQTGLPLWAAAVTAQIQKVFTEQLEEHLAAQTK